MKSFFIILAIFAGLAASPALAQVPAPTAKPALAVSRETTKAAGNTEAERLRAERRSQARSLLIALAAGFLIGRLVRA